MEIRTKLDLFLCKQVFGSYFSMDVGRSNGYRNFNMAKLCNETDIFE